MPPEDDKITDVVDQNLEVTTDPLAGNEDTETFGKDTVVDTGRSAKDLDSRLDRLMGVKPSEATTDKKDKVQQDTNIDPTTGKAKVGTEATQPNVNTSTRVDPSRTPRAYGKAFRWDTQGNVVRADTGAVVATAGAERKAFERTLPIINAIQADADKYKGMYDAASAANTIAANLKLAPEEYAIGARIMAAFKTDPKKAIAFLVKEAQDQGVDMSDLGVSGGGLTRKDVEDLLTTVVGKHLEPFKFITEDRQTQIETQQNREAAKDAINEFYQEHPDATVHEEALAILMNAKPGTSLDMAYLILQNNAMKHGFDWTKDTIPQAQAWMAKNGKGGTSNNGTGKQPVNTQRTLPDLSGRQGNDSIVTRTNVSLGGEASSGDVVREAMREAGMNVDNI